MGLLSTVKDHIDRARSPGPSPRVSPSDPHSASQHNNAQSAQSGQTGPIQTASNQSTSTLSASNQSAFTKSASNHSNLTQNTSNQSTTTKPPSNQSDSATNTNTQTAASNTTKSAKPPRPDFLAVQPGQTFNSDRYNIKSRLGIGQYSEVWLAHDNTTNTNVALKVLSNDTYNDGQKLWEREIMIKMRDVAATSKHPGRKHIVKLLDTFEHPGDPRPHVCLVMQLQGPSIQDQMIHHARARVPYHAAKRMALQLAQALDFMHTECGVIHTDITADNILLQSSKDGTYPSLYSAPSSTIDIQLADFGLACWVEEHLDDRVQRPLYRAPECTLSALWDTSADIFDLGCFVFQIVTGAAPFCGSRQRDADSVPGERERLRQLTQLFGPVPDVVLDSALRKDEFYNQDGSLRHPSSPAPSSSNNPSEKQEAVDKDSVEEIKNKAENLHLDKVIASRTRASSLGDEMPSNEVPVFADFLRDALATDPRLRKTARALRGTAWLRSVEDDE